MRVVYVTNLSDTDHADSHGGVVYKFPQHISIEVPENVAADLLGYGHPDKTEFVVRLGWCKTSQELPQALQRLEQFSITAEPVPYRSLPSAVGEVTPFPQGRGRKAIRAA